MREVVGSSPTATTIPLLAFYILRSRLSYVRLYHGARSPTPALGRSVRPQATMNTQANFLNTLKHPSAFLPVTMSLLAVVVVLTHIALFGTARQPDEGTAAHLWQLLMAGQVPIVAFFAIRWLAYTPRYALAVLTLQAGAAVAALAPVYFLHW